MTVYLQRTNSKGESIYNAKKWLANTISYIMMIIMNLIKGGFDNKVECEFNNESSVSVYQCMSVVYSRLYVNVSCSEKTCV